MFSNTQGSFRSPFSTIGMEFDTFNETQEVRRGKRSKGDDGERSAKRPRGEQSSHTPQVHNLPKIANNQDKANTLIFVFDASIKQLQENNLISERITSWINHLITNYKNSYLPWDSEKPLETALNEVNIDAWEEFGQQQTHPGLFIQMECIRNILEVFQETLNYKKANDIESLNTISQYFSG